MVQRQLPMFPEGSTLVTHDLAVEKRDGHVTYFYGTLPVFTHDENDDASFQMITAQFYTNDYVKQMDIVRAFRVTPIRNFHDTTLPVKNCVCERRRITGSMRWMVNLLWYSTRQLIPA